MASLNKVMIIGNLGRSPETKDVKGTPCTTFSVATSEKYKSPTGEWVEKTEWHNIVTWAKTAESCAKYLGKGSTVHIEGKLQTRSWDDKNGGSKRYATEIVASEVKFLSKKEDQTDSFAVDRGAPEIFKSERTLEDLPF